MLFDTSKFEAEIGSLSKSDGSAKFSINETIQLCSIFGPGEVRLMKEIAERAYVNIVYKPRIGNNTNREKVIEYELRSILDGVILTSLHPRTAINVIFQEIQNDGNYLACALNCVCLALLDANIPLKHTFVAVSCALIENENRIVFFPNSKQEKDSIVSATFAFDSVDKDVIFMNTNGLLDQDNLANLINNARLYAIEKLFPLVSQKINQKYSKFNC